MHWEVSLQRKRRRILQILDFTAIKADLCRSSLLVAANALRYGEERTKTTRNGEATDRPHNLVIYVDDFRWNSIPRVVIFFTVVVVEELSCARIVRDG